MFYKLFDCNVWMCSFLISTYVLQIVSIYFIPNSVQCWLKLCIWRSRRCKYLWTGQIKLHPHVQSHILSKWNRRMQLSFIMFGAFVSCICDDNTLWLRTHTFEITVSKWIRCGKVKLRFDNNIWFNVIKVSFFVNIFSSSFSRIIVSFKNEVYTPFKRVENYNWTDTLANIGGLAGLFLGASLLSIVELVYYSTLRIFFAFRDARKSKAQPPKRILYVVPISTGNHWIYTNW